AEPREGGSVSPPHGFRRWRNEDEGPHRPLVVSTSVCCQGGRKNANASGGLDKNESIELRSLTVSTFRTILFAADFSVSSQESFGIACALARESGTRLLVFHAVEQILFEPMSTHQAHGGFPAILPADTPTHRKELEERLRASYAADPPIDVAYLIRDGVAVEEILRLAGEERADLIIVGTHGRTGLD